MEKIKILHITFNMGIGGTEQVIRQLVLDTQDRGLHHEIACIDGRKGPIGDELASRKFAIHTLARSPGFDRQLLVALRQLIRQEVFDIVHCHQYTPFLYGRLAAMGTKAKVMFTEHGRFFPDRYRWKALAINPILALSTPALVAISSATRDALVRYEFMPRSRIKVIYNGIRPLVADASRATEVRRALDIPDDAFIYGTVSRLDYVKNQPLMIRAFAQCLKKCPNIYLLMVGDGPERGALESLVGSLGVSDQVRFTGFINEPADYLAAMDVFLLSSFTEGTSMTLLESMSLGLPSVVTRVGGNPEIIEDAITGLTTPSDDLQAFAIAMIKLQMDPSLCKQLGSGAKAAFSDRFSVDAMSGHYLTLYNQLIA
ncbi:glycosyltransferase [uncultured Marinobacter sp.]|uniref:glycosyltransferase n=1 Tax=uncultured Marinobacter sp. TaxID=187379 RepID=UPI0030DA6206